MELPFYGNLCLPVHRGYKIFNFRRKSVIRTFAAEVDPAIVATEIEAVRRAGQFDFAPNVPRWNIGERWYEEDFIDGHPGHRPSPSGGAVFIELYHRHVARCLEQMILLQAPRVTRLREYVAELARVFEGIELTRPELDPGKTRPIKRFVESTIEQLHLEGDPEVNLVFSHGDFSLVNILRTKDGIKVIDWESAERRSALCDLYNYFFTELYYGRAKSDLVDEVDEAISSLQSRLASSAPGIAQTLSSPAPRHRRLYYLERVLVLLQRELSDGVLDVTLKSIAVFNRYEKVAADHGQGEQGTLGGRT
jgi:hypothetical protein